MDDLRDGLPNNALYRKFRRGPVYGMQEGFQLTGNPGGNCNNNNKPGSYTQDDIIKTIDKVLGAKKITFENLGEEVSNKLGCSTDEVLAVIPETYLSKESIFVMKPDTKYL